MSKTDNEKLVIELYESGLTPKRIHETKRVLNRSGNPVSLRWIQQVLKVYRDGKSLGRTSKVPLFSFEDIKLMMKSPEIFEDISRERFFDYYMNRNNSLRTLRLSNIVLRRDDYTCKECGQYYDLECHHTTHEHDNTKLEAEYCVTLCKDCHIKHANKYKNKRYTIKIGDRY